MIKRYFSHDFDAASDPKLSALLSRFGGMGYALFWRIVEMLHIEQDHKIPKKNYIYSTLAEQMRTSVQQINEVLDFCFNECELFVQDDNFFWSERVLRNIGQMDLLSSKRSQAGILSGISRKKMNTCSTSVNTCSTKSNKHEQKKRKENKTNEKENITHKNIVRSSRTSEFDSTNFDRFWEAYHPAGRVSKKKTQEIWRKQNLDLYIDQILIHLSQLRKTHNWINGQYIPHATTFLNGERWKESVVQQQAPISMMTKEQKRKEEFREALRSTYADPSSTSQEKDNAEKIINPLD